MQSKWVLKNYNYFTMFNVSVLYLYLIRMVGQHFYRLFESALGMRTILHCRVGTR